MKMLRAAEPATVSQRTLGCQQRRPRAVTDCEIRGLDVPVHNPGTWLSMASKGEKHTLLCAAPQLRSTYAAQPLVCQTGTEERSHVPLWLFPTKSFEARLPFATPTASVPHAA